MSTPNETGYLQIPLGLSSEERIHCLQQVKDAASDIFVQACFDECCLNSNTIKLAHQLYAEANQMIIGIKIQKSDLLTTKI